ATHSSHELAPGAVLGVFRRVTGREPPPAVALGIEASRFGLGEPLSPGTRQAMAAAWQRLQALLASPRAEEWQTMADDARTPRVHAA
ncbi:MAG: hypothetical protein ACO28P_00835, partial [Ilumatobacteraceae bacterium]